MDASIEAALNDSNHPPMVSLSSFRPITPEDATDPSVFTPVTNLGLQPIPLLKWTFYDSLSGTPGAISEPFKFQLLEDDNDGVITNSKIFKLFLFGSYQIINVEVYDVPVICKRGGLVICQQVLLQEVPGQNTTYHNIRYLPVAIRKRRKRAKYRHR